MKNLHTTALVLSSTALFSASLISTAYAGPLETTLVSASRYEKPAREVGSSVTVMTAEDIQKRGFIAIQDVMRTLPSIAVSNSGGLGKQSALRIRGEESFRTLVLVDGVDYSDPTTTQVQTQVQHLVVSDIERIEVLRGPQGMMYGADAGGVINIITRKGQGAPSGGLQAETGRYNTRRLSGNLRGGVGQFDYAISANRIESDGFNARTNDTTSKDDDGYDNTTLNATLGMQLSDSLRMEATARDVNSESEFDGCFGVTATNDCLSDFHQRSHQVNLSWTTDNLIQRLSYQRQDLKRENFAAGTQSFLADGGVEEWQYFGSVSLTPAFKLIFGIDDEEQFIDSSSPKQKRDNTGSYAEFQGNIAEAWYFSVGTRLDDNEDFSDHWSHRVTSAYLFALDGQTLKLRGSYGTGFRAPSLFELSYNQQFSIPLVSEETSKGFDIGLDYIVDGGGSFSITYFDQTIEDAIDFDTSIGPLLDFGGFFFPSGGYVQTSGDSTSKGWEVSADIPLEPRTTLVANYTYNDTEDANGNQRVRRPKRITNLGVDHRIPTVNVTVFMNYRFVREAIDNGNVELPDYQVLDVSVNWQASDRIAVYVRGENITGKDYTEVTGFNAAGAATYAGVRFTF